MAKANGRNEQRNRGGWLEREGAERNDSCISEGGTSLDGAGPVYLTRVLTCIVRREVHLGHAIPTVFQSPSRSALRRFYGHCGTEWPASRR